MRVPDFTRGELPEYVKTIHADGCEAVMSTPAWFDKHAEDEATSRVSTVFADVRAWPPQVVEHEMRTAAATRLPDGRWVCVAKREGTWSLYWFASIAATTPSHVEPVPFEGAPLEPAEDDDEPPDDPGPIQWLQAFADKLVALASDGSARVRDGDGRWREHGALRSRRFAPARTVLIGGKPYLEWNGALYDAELRKVDALDCTCFTAVGNRVLALHAGEQLVEFADPLVPELTGHKVTELLCGPRDTLILTFARDDARGMTYERAIYDPTARTISMLSEELVGEYPKFVACTTAGGIVMHLERDHDLVEITPAQLAAIPAIPAADLPIPPRCDLAPLDDVGASSRPTVATTRDAIAMVVGRHLRIHSVDEPKEQIEIASAGVVGAAMLGERISALDTSGLLHEFTLEGVPINVRPVIGRPRSLLAANDRWVVVGASHIALVEETRTTTIEIAGAIAVAADRETGDLVIACDDRRLACWSNGQLRDLPPPIEQIVALASLGDRKFACAGTHGLYLLDLAMPELVGLGHRPRRPFLAGDGAGRIAYCPTAGSVETCDLQGTELVPAPKGAVHYSGYSRPDDSDVTVHGLAFMDDGRLVIQLDEGRGNLVDPETGSALKLDPQPGDVPSSWIFITGAGILMAG